MPAEPIIIPPGDGQAYWLLDSESILKLTAKETGGEFDLCETTAPPDSGPPPHRHSRDDEMFFILEGQFGLVFGDQSLTAKAGEAAYLPKNIVHTYKNIGSKPGRFLVWAMPSGFAEFVKAMESPVTNPHNPPPVNEATIGKLLGNIGRFGIEMLMEHRPKRQGPPLPAAQEFWFLGQRVTMHLTGDQTAGNFCVTTFTMPPGTGMVAHRNNARDGNVLRAGRGGCLHTGRIADHGRQGNASLCSAGGDALVL